MRSSGDTLAIRRASASPRVSSRIGTSPEYAKLVDLSRCIGCKACEVACKEWNELEVETTANFGSYQSHRDLSPNTWLLVRFREVEADEQLLWLIRKDACLHCGEPGCLYACPAPGAVIQYQNGIVDFNLENCIGCRYCIPACPFHIPRFAPSTGKVYKCNLCIDRVESGLEPACAKTCPTNAIAWGFKRDMLELANRRVRALQARGFATAKVYDPAGVGGTHMMYVVPHGDHFADYALPGDPVARPGTITALGVGKRVGAFLFGLGLLLAAVHYLGVGPARPGEAEGGEEEEEGPR